MRHSPPPRRDSEKPHLNNIERACRGRTVEGAVRGRRGEGRGGGVMGSKPVVEPVESRQLLGVVTSRS